MQLSLVLETCAMVSVVRNVEGESGEIVMLRLSIKFAFCIKNKIVLDSKNRLLRLIDVYSLVMKEGAYESKSIPYR